jgi:hypothetical protein
MRRRAPVVAFTTLCAYARYTASTFSAKSTVSSIARSASGTVCAGFGSWVAVRMRIASRFSGAIRSSGMPEDVQQGAAGGEVVGRGNLGQQRAENERDLGFGGKHWQCAGQSVEPRQ